MSLLNEKYHEKQIVITTAKVEDHIFMEIYNNGPTIPEEIMGKIFDPFFSTRVSSENMGLGLSIVHSIMEAHQGTVQVHNLEQGVSFQFKIPCYQEPN